MHLKVFAVHFDDPDYHEFLVAQERAYARLGHAEMVRYGKDDPYTTVDPLHCVVAFDHDGGLLGGVRVHRRIKGRLPSEVHLGSAEVNRLVAAAAAAECADGGSVAEVCGLWVEREWQGRRSDLARLVTVTGVVAAQRMGATVITGSCAAARLPAMERCGFRFRTDLPLADVPFQGVTSYFSIAELGDFYTRDEQLTAAMAVLRQALQDGDFVAADVLCAAAEHLGLRLFDSLQVA
jgi:hypothetical protein